MAKRMFLSVVFVLVLMANCVVSDFEGDKQECSEKLLQMAACISYVTGQANAPTPDCCGGLGDVLATSKKCLCIMIKDRNDPSLPFKMDPARSLKLPSECHQRANISKCPELLHLPPNSPDAKIFQQSNSSTSQTSTLSSLTGKPNTSSITSIATNEGKKWVEVEKMTDVWTWCLVTLVILAS